MSAYPQTEYFVPRWFKWSLRLGRGGRIHKYFSFTTLKISLKLQSQGLSRRIITVLFSNQMKHNSFYDLACEFQQSETKASFNFSSSIISVVFLISSHKVSFEVLGSWYWSPDFPKWRRWFQKITDSASPCSDRLQKPKPVVERTRSFQLKTRGKKNKNPCEWQ